MRSSVNWDEMIQRLRWTWLAHRRLAPLVASALIFAAHFGASRSLRMLLLALSTVLFFLTVSDMALEFMDRSYSDSEGTSPKISVSPAQFLIAAMLALVYTCLISAGLNLIFLPSTLTVFLLVPGIFLICCFVAWHNVTLWYEQGADYEQNLKELTREEDRRVGTRG